MKEPKLFVSIRIHDCIVGGRSSLETDSPCPYRAELVLDRTHHLFRIRSVLILAESARGPSLVLVRDIVGEQAYFNQTSLEII